MRLPEETGGFFTVFIYKQHFYNWMYIPTALWKAVKFLKYSPQIKEAWRQEMHTQPRSNHRPAENPSSALSTKDSGECSLTYSFVIMPSHILPRAWSDWWFYWFTGQHWQHYENRSLGAIIVPAMEVSLKTTFILPWVHVLPVDNSSDHRYHGSLTLGTKDNVMDQMLVAFTFSTNKTIYILYWST